MPRPVGPGKAPTGSSTIREGGLDTMHLTRLLLAIAVATPLAAQQPDAAKRPPMPMGQMIPGGAMGPMMEEMGEMMGPMMRGMVFSPAHLLTRRDALHLTDQQVAKLTALRDAAQANHGAAMTEMHTHAREMMAAMAGATPDTAHLKPHFPGSRSRHDASPLGDAERGDSGARAAHRNPTRPSGRLGGRDGADDADDGAACARLDAGRSGLRTPLRRRRRSLSPVCIGGSPESRMCTIC